MNPVKMEIRKHLEVLRAATLLQDLSETDELPNINRRLYDAGFIDKHGTTTKAGRKALEDE